MENQRHAASYNDFELILWINKNGKAFNLNFTYIGVVNVGRQCWQPNAKIIKMNI